MLMKKTLLRSAFAKNLFIFLNLADISLIEVDLDVAGEVLIVDGR